MAPAICSRMNSALVYRSPVHRFAARFGLATGQAGYRAAAELANQNGIIQIDDVMAAAAAFGRNC